jgi:hypothetical protein
MKEPGLRVAHGSSYVNATRSVANRLPALLRGKPYSITTALWCLFADLSPKDFDRGGGAPHHHGFRVQAALVQCAAPIIKFCEDIHFAARGAGSLVIELMYVGHTPE